MENDVKFKVGSNITESYPSIENGSLIYDREKNKIFLDMDDMRKSVGGGEMFWEVVEGGGKVLKTYTLVRFNNDIDVSTPFNFEDAFLVDEGGYKIPLSLFIQDNGLWVSLSLGEEVETIEFYNLTQGWIYPKDEINIFFQELTDPTTQNWIEANTTLIEDRITGRKWIGNDTISPEGFPAYDGEIVQLGYETKDVTMMTIDLSKLDLTEDIEFTGEFYLNPGIGDFSCTLSIEDGLFYTRVPNVPLSEDGHLVNIVFKMSNTTAIETAYNATTGELEVEEDVTEFLDHIYLKLLNYDHEEWFKQASKEYSHSGGRQWNLDPFKFYYQFGGELAPSMNLNGAFHISNIGNPIHNILLTDVRWEPEERKLFATIHFEGEEEEINLLEIIALGSDYYFMIDECDSETEEWLQENGTILEKRILTYGLEIYQDGGPEFELDVYDSQGHDHALYNSFDQPGWVSDPGLELPIEDGTSNIFYFLTENPWTYNEDFYNWLTTNGTLVDPN